MVVAIYSSETSILTRATRRNISEDGLLHSHRRENFKSYKLCLGLLSCLFPSGFPTTSLHAGLVAPVRAAFPTDLTHLPSSFPLYLATSDGSWWMCGCKCSIRGCHGTWMSRYGTSQKAAGSNPDELIQLLQFAKTFRPHYSPELYPASSRS
jgi:hypothetical protein